MKFLLYDIEIRVTSIKSIGVRNSKNVLKVSLEKLECDKRLNKVVSYIEEKGIEELDLGELDYILKEFPYLQCSFMNV